MSKTLLISALALVLAIIVGETILLRKGADQLSRTEARASELRSEINRLKTLIAEATHLASEQHSAIIPTPPENDPSAATTRALHGRVRSLQRMFELVPEEQIPELRFLSDNDWISIVIDRELTTAKEFTSALGWIRNKARIRFNALLKSALKKHLAASSNILPETPLALLPYFDPPIDPAILARHEMILSGSTSGLEPRTAVMREKASITDGPADNLAETGLSFTKYVSAQPHATHRIKPEILTALAEATLAFRRDYPGNDAATFDQLRPYLKNPAEAARAVDELEAAAPP